MDGKIFGVYLGSKESILVRRWDGKITEIFKTGAGLVLIRLAIPAKARGDIKMRPRSMNGKWR